MHFKNESELSMIPNPVECCLLPSLCSRLMNVFCWSTVDSYLSILSHERVYNHLFSSFTVQMMTQRETFSSNLCEFL